jgi:murein L,D-transpeptidase YafK
MKNRFVILIAVMVGSLLMLAHALRAGEDSLPQGLIADKVVVYKRLRELRLIKGTDTVKTYRISLGANPIGPKERQGDGRTPEGSYTIDWRKSNSSFHLALHISYPDSSDKARAKRRGVSAGGMIMIHGLPNGFEWNGSPGPLSDWTDGCIAVSNAEIEELWRCVRDGTRIVLLP